MALIATFNSIVVKITVKRIEHMIISPEPFCYMEMEEKCQLDSKADS